MTCAERIRIIKLIEKMEAQPEYSKKLGLEDVSAFHGNAVRNSNIVTHT